ncbi:MAG: hypothetical protein ACYS9X_03110, partial [Planctomycetota bacterium]
VFEFPVPLGEEAPMVAAQGDLVAFGAGHEVKVVDARTGSVTFKQSLVPGAEEASLASEARVLGLLNGTVIACVGHFTDPDRLDPGGQWGRVGGGPEPGEFEVVAVDIKTAKTRPIARLPSGVTLAEGLLGTALVYTEERALHLVSLVTGATREFALPGEPLLRPVVRDGQLLGRYEGGAYILAAADGEPRFISFKDTALARLSYGDSLVKCGDLLVGCVAGKVVACELDGRLRWRIPIFASVIAGGQDDLFALRWGTFWPVICRLDPRDGNVVWKACVSPRESCVGTNDIRGVEVFGRRLVIFAEKDIAVYDHETGRLLLNLPQSRDLVRTSHQIHAVLLRMGVAANVLAIAHEDRVFGVDLTPTAEVAEELQTSDPANALRQVGILNDLAAAPIDRTSAVVLAGHNMADTPEAAAGILPALRGLLAKEPSSYNLGALLRAFYWLDDDGLLRSARDFLGMKTSDHSKASIIDILACHPAPAKGLAVLREVIGDRRAYSARIRAAAAMWLRLSGERPAVRPEDLRLLFSADHDAITAEMRRRLREGDTKARAAACKLLKMAPDVVIVALEQEFDLLPEEERAQGQGLLREAKARLEAIARSHRPEPVPERRERARE